MKDIDWKFELEEIEPNDKDSCWVNIYQKNFEITTNGENIVYINGNPREMWITVEYTNYYNNR